MWGLGQLATGAASDRLGRKWLIVGGMWLQAAALSLVAIVDSFTWWAHPAWRARSVGVYRLWRDAGFAIGALVGGITADLYGLRPAVAVVAALTAASGAVVALRMYETHQARPDDHATPRAQHAGNGSEDHR